jgi:hypothetical protein
MPIAVAIALAGRVEGGLADRVGEQGGGRATPLTSSLSAYMADKDEVTHCEARQVLLAVAGARVSLAGDAVVVPVQPVRIAPGPAVLQEEDLRRALTREVGAVLVACRRRRWECREQQRDDRADADG